MKTYNNIYATKIHAIMLPLVGDFMASGVLKTQTKSLGIDEETIKPEHISQLADGIKKGLSIFLGSDGAVKICDQIKAIK
jgi:hypothetical protein